MGIAAVIMAGGRGERFWPRSREDRPKQFLSFQGEKTLLQQTVGRLESLVPSERVWVVTGADYLDLTSEQLSDIPQEQILLEPHGRDTAPCIALSALYIAHQDPNAVMVVLPADHLILQEERFRQVLKAAVELAETGENLITLGMQPTRPETGYGYIQLGEQLHTDSGAAAHRVSRFREKPSIDVALQYLQQGGYLWNSGIFIWRVDAIQRAIREHLPELWEGLAPLRAALGTVQEQDVLRQVWPTLPKISIDYGIMERVSNAVVLPADFGWDDLGTWASMGRVFSPDANGNIVSGRVLAVETTNSILQSDEDRLVVTYGLSDVVVVDTEDVLLVASKERVSDLKVVTKLVEAHGFKGHLKSAKRLLPTAAD